MRIKICGITRLEDALSAASLGAWAVGFIFYEKSKRYIEPSKAKEIIDQLPTWIFKVGVFVDNVEAAQKNANEMGLDIIQFHGQETPDECMKTRMLTKCQLIKAFRPASFQDLDRVKTYRGMVDFALVDACVDGALGGTGQMADWGLAKKIRKMGFDVLLSGGIGPDNAKEAMRVVKPFALDLASSIESAPGIKDKEKMKALFSDG